MKKLFLLDAYALIYRSYYALIKSPRVNTNGFNTSAIMGFCNTLNEVINKESPDYMAVAFDHGKTFRNEAYPAYKAQRESTPEDIKKSVPIIKQILKAFRIPMIQVDGFEADDVIGSIVKKMEKEDVMVYMLTPDKDYAQLVNEWAVVYSPKHGGGYETLGIEEVVDKYSFETPQQMVDFLGLVGDTADNFPGCPGVGPKTAKLILEQFNSIDGLLQHIDKLSAKLRAKIEPHIEDIKMSRFLAAIRTDVPVNITLEEMKMKTPDVEALYNIYTDLELKTLRMQLLKKIKKERDEAKKQADLFAINTANGTAAPENTSISSLKNSWHKYKLAVNQEEAQKICDFFLTKKNLGIGIETTSVHAIEAELVGLSFSSIAKEAFYIALPTNKEEAQKIIDIFRPLFQDPNITKVGHNIKYDMEVLLNYGIELKGTLFDTMLAHYVIQPELPHTMEAVAEHYLKYHPMHIEELIGEKGKHQKSICDLPPEQVYEYACEKADITLRLYRVLEPELRRVNADQLFWDIEMPLVPVLADMERNGVLLDTKALKDTSAIFNQRMSDCEQRIYAHAGHPFNISSPKQVGEILFGELQIMEKPKKTRTGQYVTSEEVLLSISSKHPIVQEILNYRAIKKLLSTYVDALPQLINPKTGHIHTSFNQALTATGRLSSSDPNLQNIPVRTDDGKEIRKCFIPEPGCLFFSADYSQIELRIMAHLSGDKSLIWAFEAGTDIHAVTASKIWNKKVEDVTPEERKKAKQANFGIIYGITAYGLAQRMGISNVEARHLIQDYFAKFPKVLEFKQISCEFAQKNGYVKTIFGRRRYLPDINSDNNTVRSFAERNAINAPIQGSEADIIKVAMIRIWRRFRSEGIRSKMILQVHDELNFSVYPEEKEQVEHIVLEEMQQAYKLKVPLVVDAGWGSNWLEAH